MIYDLLIFTNNPKAYAPQRIKEELKRINKSCLILEYSDINFDAKNVSSIKNVFFRDFGESGKYSDLIEKLTSYFEKKGAKVINNKSFKKYPSLDKIKQYEQLNMFKVPTVESLIFGSKKGIVDWATEDKFPFIAKSKAGSQGRGVMKIENEYQLISFLKNQTDGTLSSFLIQPFLTSGEDIRVIIVGGNVLGAIKRIAPKGKYLTNYSQGGEVEPYDIEEDKEAKEIAIKAADCFFLEYCGVDLMKGEDGDWKVLEVNRACQFKGFELATQINVALQVVELLR